MILPKKIRLSYLLSILIHLFLIFFLFLHFIYNIDIRKKEPLSPSLYTPAYFYQPASEIHAATKQTNNIHFSTQKNSVPTSSEKSIIRQQAKAILAATEQYLSTYQYQSFSNATKYTDPVYMIGEDKVPPDPLIRLLAYALSAHFHYPEKAGKFGITGKTIIGMTLYPDGHLADIQILDSSGDIDLDDAALYAVNTAPNIKKAQKFISNPKHFIIGFIFKTYSR